MNWDLTKAITYLQKHAQPGSTGYCAAYVRQAIQARGLPLMNTPEAKDYGRCLKAVGFLPISSGATYLHMAGDVGVIQPIPGQPHGHMAMFDGVHWISDFVQQHGLYPGKGYRTVKPSYTIYRYPSK